MSEQGERPPAEDDWWARLYDGPAPDTGPARSSDDTLDDRFDSAAGTVSPGGPPPPPPPRPASWWEVLAPDTSGRAGTQVPHPSGASDDPPSVPRPTGSAGAADRPTVPRPGGPGAAGDGPSAERPAGGSGSRPAWWESPPVTGMPHGTSDPGGRPPSPPGATGDAPSARQPAVPPARPPGTPGPAGPDRQGHSGRPDGVRAEAAPPGWGDLPDEASASSAQPSEPGDTSPPPPGRVYVPAQTRAEPDPVADPRSAGPETPLRPVAGVVGGGPPTYDSEPAALPAAQPDALGELVADTVLDGARYGSYTLRAASVRGDSARFRGEPRREALLTARFGDGPDGLVLVVVAAGARAAEGAHLAASDACRWIGGAVGRSHARLVEDIRAGRRGNLKSGLHRLVDRSYGKLRARAAEMEVEPEEYTVSLRCLLLSADPDCRTRVFFGVGGGGLFRLRDGAWQDIEPLIPEPDAVTGAPVVGYGSAPAGDAPSESPEGDRLTMDLGIPTPPSPYVETPPPPPAEPFRFRASVARPGDTLLLCSTGLADPIRGEPALAKELAARWRSPEAPGMAAFLADTQLRVKGYADDRTAVAVWEA
ncbi:protein phosphatase 2C domain-containing protein [Streptomyces sp. NBC_00390]|uniref:protein phosphatase 2C domain-containing protein n=1 Tax=Streptomyces sp. NBC_00390 TaxID=2975736 RepID=UPI002E2473FD